HWGWEYITTCAGIAQALLLLRPLQWARCPAVLWRAPQRVQRQRMVVWGCSVAQNPGWMPCCRGAGPPRHRDRATSVGRLGAFLDQVFATPAQCRRASLCGVLID